MNYWKERLAKMLTKEECNEALENISNLELQEYEGLYGRIKYVGDIRFYDYRLLRRLIKEHFEMVDKLKTGDLSDGYHTYNELYHHRAVLFSVVINQNKEIAWKSKKHHDGTMYDGMFIVGIDTPQGQYSYHYDIEPYWNMFECKELDNAPVWDGHKPEDINRLQSLNNNPPLKLDEIKKGMWVWINGKHREKVYGVGYDKVWNYNVVYICEHGTDYYGETYPYEPNCFYRKEVI